YAILGTDISSEVLKTARMAIYPSAMVDPVPTTLRERYVMVARHAGRQEVRIVPELRRRAQFHQLNLMDHSYPFDRDVDVIFCRNVLIYFDKATQKAVLRRLAGHLRPGGFLILGHSESMAGGADVGLRQVVSTVFQA
ncbi:MAG: methyltransferase domain-containing protein, partial [Caulobacteraceae bacterium]|nr:methyltransferase domain-containing protein [Caulobacter sp.]